MKLENRGSLKRFSMLLLILVSTAAMTGAVLAIQKAQEGKWLLTGICGLIFCIFLGLHLEWERMEHGPCHERSNNFVRIGTTYAMGCLIIACTSFLPDYARPVMLMPVLMTMVSDSFTGLIAGCYGSLLLTVTGTGSVCLLAYYLLLCAGGCVIIRYLKSRRHLWWCGFMIITVTFCLAALFSTMETQEFSWRQAIYGLLNGGITALAVPFIFRMRMEKIENSRDLFLDRILEEGYELSKTMEQFSAADYAHGRKVSKIAGECAKAIGADQHLAAAAGLYYRVGRLEGEPFVENGIDVALKHRFPPELVRILSEYNGEKYLPSTVESALVHIVDHVVAKFDVLDSNTLSSSWNQDIVVYQTLNENSAKGLYDKSGLSMNLYLLIRDFLIKEAQLYDSNHGK